MAPDSSTALISRTDSFVFVEILIVERVLDGDRGKCDEAIQDGVEQANQDHFVSLRAKDFFVGKVVRRRDA